MAEKPDPTTAGAVAQGAQDAAAGVAGGAQALMDALGSPGDASTRERWKSWDELTPEEQRKIRSDMVAEMPEGGPSAFWPKSTAEQEAQTRAWARGEGITRPSTPDELTTAEKDMILGAMQDGASDEDKAAFQAKSPQQQAQDIFDYAQQYWQ